MPPRPSSQANLLAQQVKQEAARLGFDLCRIAPAGPAPHATFFADWIARSRAGEMSYLERNVEKRQNPHLLAEAESDDFRSLIVLAVNHHQFDLAPNVRDDPSRGIIASYAWGDDYHEIIRPLLFELDGFIRAKTGRTTRGKCLVDTGPVLERDWAQQAGIGFTGKNCCTIHPKKGSWLLLATIMVPEELAADPPPDAVSPLEIKIGTKQMSVLDGLPADAKVGEWRFEIEDSTAKDSIQIGTCGRCTRCLDACPTNAFVGPFHLDPQRCISYWTIEAKAEIPRALRPLFGNRIFGCDICQEVCPWNQRLEERTPLLTGLQAQSERIAPPLLEGFDPTEPYWLHQDAFSRRFRRSPIKRAKRSGMLRNVCVALGNWADPCTVDALQLALGDPEPIARIHAAWALGQVLRTHQGTGVYALLYQAQESDNRVQEEIALAIAR